MPPNKDEGFLECIDSADSFLGDKEKVKAGNSENLSVAIFKMDPEKVDYNQDIYYGNALGLVVIHALAFYGFFTGVTVAKGTTHLFFLINGYFTGIGITAGVHRLWSHRSYKANLPLRIILMLCYATTGQNKLRSWVLDHRVHHKYSETPADPHNANRGLFFAHIGWLMKKKHPTCLQLGKKIDMSDIDNDAVVKFFDDNFILMKTVFCFLLPIGFVYYVLEEPLWIAFYGNMVRYILTLNGTWVINSLAHTFGDRPYDKSIGPSESLISSIWTMGEGWHNYHHTFPWDYRTSEFGVHTMNIPGMFIDFFAKFGWAYDRKTTSKELIMRQATKKGDGTRVGGHFVVEAAEATEK